MSRRARWPLAVVAVASLSAAAPALGAQEDGWSQHAIAEAVDGARRACEVDDGRLWGLSLCGPLLFADVEGRRLIASRAAPGADLERAADGLHVGPLPDDLPVANRAIEWAGVEWAMVLLPLPEDPPDRIELLMHESFHRIQDELGLTATDQALDHLATEEGRVWLRLELRALARALSADSTDAREALRDVLAFRARRQAAPGAREAETALELQEGLAAYTGAVLAVASRDVAETRAVELLDAFDDRDSYARSLAYATGPALGLLADRYAPGWRGRIVETRDMAGELAALEEAGVVGGRQTVVEDRGRGYGLEAVRAEEAERRRETEKRLADYRKRLVEGPVLVVPLQEMQMTFDPNAVTPLGEHGTVYPSLTLRDRWGTLIVEEGGVLIAPDFTRAAVPWAGGRCAPSGSGWSLDLATGWVVLAGGRGEECRVAESHAPGALWQPPASKGLAGNAAVGPP